ncbi:MAG: SDR family NAD(P)-dependent oxidoreductase [Merismopedia sp. SIO2A8]|nr:SDR family NAD(P)-dependent oxidoreductase [Merismopedia sp. SIO2A8]
MLKIVQDAHVLIVGASQGIGYGFVQALLSIPAIQTIYATYRDSKRAEALLALQEGEGDRLVCIPMDITQEAEISAGIEQIKARTPHLALVVNCVGFLHDDTTKPEKSLKQLNAEQLTRYFQINSIGPVLLAKYLVPLLKGRDRSIFATISAKVGSIGDNYLGGWYGYRSSKAALNMLMRTAAIEYGRKSHNTIVVMLHPGTTDTRLSKPFQRSVPPGKLFSVEKTVSQLLSVIDSLKQEDSGHFFSWDGSRLPW